MEKYKSENTTMGGFNEEPISQHTICFDKEDGTRGMEVNLTEILNDWVDQYNKKQENEERRGKKEIADKKWREKIRIQNEKETQVQNKLKPFLTQCIKDTLEKLGLELTKRHIRNVIRNCKIEMGRGSVEYEPIGKLFTEEQWNEFKEECNKIYRIDNPLNPRGYYDVSPHNPSTYNNKFTFTMKELIKTDIGYWRGTK